ncbi:MAG: tape measure protein [Treponema sp.]|nr:tape measure protein [Treponema sp.]
MSDKTLELQIRIAAEEAARIISALKGDVKALADESGKYAQSDGAALNRTLKETETAAKDTARSINDIFKAIGNLAEVAIAMKALSAIKDMGAFALQTADNFQTARNQFGILLQDMEAGAGLFNEIKAFGDVTPFDLDTLTQATNVLVSAKVPLQDLQSQLTKFGDLSQGNTQRFTSYINAFSQAAAKGKADMQVLNTYLNQGVPILDALAKNFGVTTAEIMKMSSEGKISFAEFSKALDDLTAAGGQYFGGMELASKSLAAMQEGLSEAVNTLAASFGEMLMPAAIAVVQALTDITNAINESPILKGLLTGAIIALTGYLAAMAVKAGIAFAAQMSLNLAIGALNPVVLASTIAVAGIAAGYTIMSANAQKAARDAENLAIAQKKQNEVIEETAELQKKLSDQKIKDMVSSGIEELQREQGKLRDIIKEIGFIEEEIKMPGIKSNIDELNAVLEEYINHRDTLIERIFAQQTELNKALAFTGKGINLNGDVIDIPVKVSIDMDGVQVPAELEKTKKSWQEWFGEITKIDTSLFGDSGAKAAKLYIGEFERTFTAKSTIAKVLGEQLDVAGILRKRQSEVQNALVELFSINPEQINQPFSLMDNAIKELITEYQKLGEEAKKLEDSLTITSTLEKLSLELQNVGKDQYDFALAALAAANATEEKIKQAEKIIETLRGADIDPLTSKLDKVRESVKNWQEELSNSIFEALMDLKMFSEQTAVILTDLSVQLIELSASAALSGFEELGRSLGLAEEGANHLLNALAQMAHQILRQLPMMYLQAGLQLIANGMWPLGLGFIAAAGTSAVISGFVDGTISKASQHAHGSAFDEYGNVARAYAAGGAFTNQIVSAPTFFRYGGGFERGLMGEAGPEAIMPLTRMPNGDLGVQTGGTGAKVIVNIINNSGAEVSKEENVGADGSEQIDVIIGDAFNRHIASGKADRIMAGRYGTRPVGV